VPKQGETARRPAWPEDAVFRRLVLDVESDSCEHCGATLHVCDHRFHRIHTQQGSDVFLTGVKRKLPLGDGHSGEEEESVAVGGRVDAPARYTDSCRWFVT
jgi:hypothetical protein